MDSYTYLRFKDTIGSPKGTFGCFMRNLVPFAVGLELPRPIIPVGDHLLSWYLSPAHGKNVWLFDSVPGHAGVELHIGNSVSDIIGCMLIGTSYGLVMIGHDTTDGILGSGNAFLKLQSMVGTSNPWKLTIKEV